MPHDDRRREAVFAEFSRRLQWMKKILTPERWVWIRLRWKVLTQKATQPDVSRLRSDPEYAAKVRRLKDTRYRARALIDAMWYENAGKLPFIGEENAPELVALAQDVKTVDALEGKLQASAVKYTAQTFFMTLRQVQKIVADSRPR
jgi:hypothetical protein